MSLFLCHYRHKEKALQKEMPNTGLRAPYPRHCAWSTTLEKVDKTKAQVSANIVDNYFTLTERKHKK